MMQRDLVALPTMELQYRFACEKRAAFPTPSRAIWQVKGSVRCCMRGAHATEGGAAVPAIACQVGMPRRHCDSCSATLP
eukprot:CAMPEP_0180523246 /NCGR_PEP_ID=MMETSP1036_2-20121128/57909_1 /TAXON_ID=632150 /ORGANISM="Azadinium spinosum, Strain 3D9" /LENGTH=78 /DNA_ID=CAMNT_0022536219 /DNA_START=29 /DNA_END=262 /DNA_ORIENTATION=+